MTITTMDEPGSRPPLLVRVKRRLDEEPLPEILMEEPRRSSDKRVRPDATAAALRLVDSVGSQQWPDEEYGLPASWFHAAANASWPSTMPEGCLQKLPAVPSLHEASRRMIESWDGGTMLIDVDREDTEMSGVPTQEAAPASFTINGVEMVATAAPAIKSSAEFVWDVYALSDTPAPNLAASLRLQDPLELDLEDGLDDLEDIDDSSDEGRPCGPDSDSDDWHETQDHSNWTDVLD
eukprot:s394_g15.t1